MSFGEWLIRITAWLAFVLWFVGVAQMLRTTRSPGSGKVALIWFAGSLVMLVHDLCSFHFRHDWSHEAAVIETARQTNELTGVNWGGGVWLNYMFSGIWLVDAVHRLARPLSYAAQPRWLTVTVHSFLAFIWFNATVVFGSKPIQITGALAFLYLFQRLLRARAEGGRNESLTS